MAFLANALAFTGSLGELTAYRMQGVDRIVVRKKGGASRERINSHPRFERTRENNQEWKACILGGKMVRYAIRPVKPLADHNYSGGIHALCKSVQLGEGMGRRGERGVPFSQSLYKLEGFGLNKYHVFDSILRHPLEYSIDRQAGKATIQLPEIVPGINLNNPRKQAMFRFIFSLGMLPDIVFDQEDKEYKAVPRVPENSFTAVYTPWCAFKAGCDAQEVTITMDGWQEQPSLSLVLSAGVDFGQPMNATEVRPTKYAGAAKVLKLV